MAPQCFLLTQFNLVWGRGAGARGKGGGLLERPLSTPYGPRSALFAPSLEAQLLPFLWLCAVTRALPPHEEDLETVTAKTTRAATENPYALKGCILQKEHGLWVQLAWQ